MVKVSIVVPVYNVEGYIIRCLRSIQSQTFQDIEVIVINDGSTDSSFLLAKKFCQSDRRFKLITHENKGLGPTRNVGTKLATGDFICYVDSDDYIDHRMIEKLYIKAQGEESDVVCGEMSLVHPDGSSNLRASLKNIPSIELKNLDQERKEEFYRNYYFGRIYSHSACDKLYSRDLLVKHDVTFGNNKLVFGEDNFFQLQLLLVANKISFIDEVVYFYVQREDSIVHSYKPDLINRQLNMIKYYERLTQSRLSKKITSLLCFEAVTMEVININESKLGYSDFRKTMIEARKDVIFNEKIADIINLKSYNLISDRNRRQYTKLVSLLEKMKLHSLSTILIYAVYSVMND